MNEVGSEHRTPPIPLCRQVFISFACEGATSGGVWTSQVCNSDRDPTRLVERLLVQASSGAVLLLVGLAAYNYRVHQIARTMKPLRWAMAERTRMARDLHDTFLQTIQGSNWWRMMH